MRDAFLNGLDSFDTLRRRSLRRLNTKFIYGKYVRRSASWHAAAFARHHHHLHHRHHLG